MEMKKVYFMNNEGVVVLRMVSEGDRYFDIIEETEYTTEELRAKDMYLSEEEAWEAYESFKATIEDVE